MEQLTRADLVSVVRSVAGELGITGVLQVHEEQFEQAPFGKFAHSDIYLSSSEEDSCPITLALFEEGDPYVTISFGGSSHEAWSPPPHETLAVVRAFSVAVMRGNYEEWRRAKRKGDDSVYGLLKDDEGNELYSDLGRVSADRLVRRGYRRMAFRPW